MTESKAMILGAAGKRLSEDEKAFHRAEKPWGFILFARNIDTADQVRALVAEMREAVDRPDAPVFIDQEGGRVQRLRPPLAPNYPPAAELGALYARDPQAGLRSAWLMARLHAFDLLRLGITADCLPVLDVHVTSTTGKGPTRAPRRPPPSAPEIAALDLSKLDTPEPAPAPAPPREAPSRVSPRAITAVDSPIADVGTATSLRAIASQVALAAPHQPPAEPSAFKLPEPVATDEGFHITMDLPVLDKETIENEDVKRRIERLEALARRDSALIEKLINTLVDRGILGADEIAKLLGSRGQ